MVSGYKDANNKFHPISPSKGVSRKKRIHSTEMMDAKGGVKIHIKQFNEGIRLRRINRNKDPKNLEWGFDLTDFKNGQFKDVLKGLGIAEGDVTDDIGEDLDGKPYRRGFVWHGEGIEITTGNNPITGQYSNPNMREPEVNYASYIGITGLPDQVKMAVKLIKKHSDFRKGESQNRREFI